MVKNIAILDAPSNLGLMPPYPGKEPGVRKMPEVLHQFGITEKMNARDAGIVFPPSYCSAISSHTNIRNSDSIRNYTFRLADAIEKLIQEEHFPLVLGGDCSILLGGMLALKRLGNYGLLFIDGHRDFQTPETSATSGAAGMDLALVTGYGPDELTCFYNYEVLVEEHLVAAIGYRDFTEHEIDGSANIFNTKIHLYDLQTVRQHQPEKVAENIIKTIGPYVSGFWIHLDVDVLDSSIMRAVDSPIEGGMTYSELDRMLQAFFKNECIVGMDITIYDPERDPSGKIGKELAKWIVNLFNNLKRISAGNTNL